jgi:pyruvate dehydrogenase E2 component (dihydrolipoyllysine-residue acetyltransferase)
MSAEGVFELTMPKWGLSMTEGKVVDWLVPEGAEVGPGIEMLEVETEKILSAVEAPQSGILRRKVAQAGDMVPVGGLLGVIAKASVPDSVIDGVVTGFKADTRGSQSVGRAMGDAPESVQVGGRVIRYLKRGEGSLAAILIHGFGGDLNNWLFNHESLATNRAVYALDLPGHGGSSKQVVSGSLQEFSEILSGFMSIVEVPRAHLVGHSMGGAVAMEYALAHPDRTASLTLIASAGLGAEIDGEYVDGFITASRRKEIKPHLEKLFGDPSVLGRRLIEDILQYKRLDGVEPALREIAAQFCPGGKQAVVLRDRLRELPMPVLVIWGAKDRILPVSHAQDLPEHIQTQILPDAGHMVQMEAAAKVNRLIHSFWNSV